jgi:hypothetical protein
VYARPALRLLALTAAILSASAAVRRKRGVVFSGRAPAGCVGTALSARDRYGNVASGPLDLAR